MLSVDQIYCGGDFINPFRESVEVWEYLKSNKVPTVRGNHEDYIINWFRDRPARTGWMTFNVPMTKQLADYLGAELADELEAVPFELEIEFPDGEYLHLCHASFNCNYRSHADEFTSEIREFVLSHRASLFVSGHKHHQDKIFVDNKQMVIIGSLGMPLNQDNRAQYITVERKEGSWNVENHRVPYYVRKTISYFEKYNWLVNSGSMGLLMMDQLLTGENRLSPFIKWLQAQRSADPKDAPASPEEWLSEGIRYLKKFNRLEVLKQVLTKETVNGFGL